MLAPPLHLAGPSARGEAASVAPERAGLAFAKVIPIRLHSTRLRLWGLCSLLLSEETLKLLEWKKLFLKSARGCTRHH